MKRCFSQLQFFCTRFLRDLKIIWNIWIIFFVNFCRETIDYFIIKNNASTYRLRMIDSRHCDAALRMKIVYISSSTHAHLRYFCQLTLFYGSLFRMPRENCSVALDLPRFVAAKNPIYDFWERTRLLKTGRPNKDIRHRAGKIHIAIEYVCSDP